MNARRVLSRNKDAALFKPEEMPDPFALRSIPDNAWQLPLC
jgi:hypothetical protein